MNAVVMQAEGLVRHYRVSRGFLRGQATVHALDGVGFSLRAGQTLAVVGESGCGKSTLARLLTMIESPSAGRLLIDGQDVAAADAVARARLRREVQIVFQNPYGALNPRQTVGQALIEPLEVNGIGADDAEREALARAMLARVGLRPEHFHRWPHMFSGGQRQRIAIARALMPRPRVLVLDEPVSALDVSIRAQVLNLLAELQRELGVAYLFISHDLGVVRHVADEVMVMYLGRCVEQGPRDAVFDAPRHPYTRQPYLPGSSIKGKMRSLLEWRSGAVQSEPLAYARIVEDAYQTLKDNGAMTRRDQANQLEKFAIVEDADEARVAALEGAIRAPFSVRRRQEEERAGGDEGGVLRDRLRDGASFTTRRVAAFQEGEAIFSLEASFQLAGAPDLDQLRAYIARARLQHARRLHCNGRSARHDLAGRRRVERCAHKAGPIRSAM